MTKRVRTTAARARGAVLVEYALLLTFVAIPTMMGITAGGVKMLADYRSSRTTLMAPIP
ncbi:MAG TPA: hypothetical protein PLR99_02170 [Polyangiaceae bacterium]|nr:hypothetical protein [Polyangiaceae bacterium]